MHAGGGEGRDGDDLVCCFLCLGALKPGEEEGEEERKGKKTASIIFHFGFGLLKEVY